MPVRRSLGLVLGGALLVSLAIAVIGDLAGLGGGAQAQGSAADPALVERGAYLAVAGNCTGCHTAAGAGAAPLAGGRRLPTPFGTIWVPNITPDPDHGIGRWTEAEFVRAMRQGVAPDGTAYYPAFPYPSYTGMSDADVAALWAWLRTVPAVAQANRPQELRFPFNYRALLTPWRWLYFEDARFARDASRDDAWNRGAYLVNALGHCGECHTERNRLGAPRESRAFAGSPDNAEGDAVPNITPHPDGIGEWSDSDIAWYLEAGTTPDYEPAGGLMAQIVKDSTGRLTRDDRRAIAAYLKSLPPLPSVRRGSG